MFSSENSLKNVKNYQANSERKLPEEAPKRRKRAPGSKLPPMAPSSQMSEHDQNKDPNPQKKDYLRELR
jgi:hypothetical protein